MKFLVLITVPAYGEPVLKQIHEFCNSVLKSHELCVFMYGDGVYNALASLCPATDEYSVSSAWKTIYENGAKLYVCESAGKRRGVIESNCASYCSLSTLGELSSLMSISDRVIEF